MFRGGGRAEGEDPRGKTNEIPAVKPAVPREEATRRATRLFLRMQGGRAPREYEVKEKAPEAQGAGKEPNVHADLFFYPMWAVRVKGYLRRLWLPEVEVSYLAAVDAGTGVTGVYVDEPQSEDRQVPAERVLTPRVTDVATVERDALAEVERVLLRQYRTFWKPRTKVVEARLLYHPHWLVRHRELPQVVAVDGLTGQVEVVDAGEPRPEGRPQEEPGSGV